MKKYYLTLLAMLMVFSTTVYSQQSAQRVTPRPQAPGVEFKMENSVASDAVKAKKRMKRVNLETAKPVVAITADAKVGEYATYDTLLLAKYTEKENDKILKTHTYTYNEYGHRRLVTYGTASNDEAGLLRYTYTIGKFNYWTSRLIETKEYGSDEWIYDSKEEREIDNQGRIVSRKIYETDSETGKMYLGSERVYDYTHPYRDDNSETVYGYCVKEITYNSDGRIYNMDEYAWHAQSRAYVLKNRITSGGGFKIEGEFTDDCIYYKTYEEEYDTPGVYILTNETVIYCGNKMGKLVKRYDENGELYDCYGNMSVKEDNTPSAGYTTITNYEEYSSSKQAWQPSSRHIISGMKITDYSAGDEWSYEKQFNVNYTREVAYYEDGEWQEYSKEVGKWQSGYILEQKYYQYDISSTLYTKYAADGSYVGEIIYNADGSYIIATTDFIDGKQSGAYIYYDAAGNVTKTLVALYVESSGDITNIPQAYTKFYIKEGDILTPVTEFETYAGSATMRYVTKYTFTEDGYPKEIVYSTEDNGNVYVTDKIVYEYNSKGYKQSQYYTVDASLILSSTNEYTLLDNGTYCYTSFEYDYEGNILGAFKKEFTKEHITIYYEYDYNAEKFNVSYKNCEPLVSTAVDGTVTIIYRAIDSDGNIVNTGKVEEFSTDASGMSAYYDWDVENNKWVGTSKYYSKEELVKFAYKEPADPCNMYDDEYFFDLAYDALSLQPVYVSSISYEWDNAADGWRVSDENSYEFEINGNTLVCTHTMAYPRWTTVVKYTAVGNANGYLDRLEEYHVDGNDDNKGCKFIKEYKYNSDNLPVETKMESVDAAGNTFLRNIKTYEYANYTLQPTTVEDVKACGDAIKVSGMEISSLDNALVTLYNMNGTKVARGRGKVVAPCAGRYIVKCGGRAVKVVIE